MTIKFKSSNDDISCEGGIKTRLLILMAVLMAIGSAAGDPSYGSKVLPYDADESRALSAFSSAPVFAYSDANIRGVFDISDPVYIDVDPSDDAVNENDVRLTPFGTYPAGSQVRLGDQDYGYKLTPFGIGGMPGAQLVYFDVDGDGAYSIVDPVYLDVGPEYGRIDAGDVRITGYMTLQAGSRVRDSDPDNDKPAPVLPGLLCFMNLNGNINSGGWAIYDQGDRIYVDTQHPFYTVTVNDIRLFI